MSEWNRLMDQIGKVRVTDRGNKWVHPEIPLSESISSECPESDDTYDPQNLRLNFPSQKETEPLRERVIGKFHTIRQRRLSE